MIDIAKHSVVELELISYETFKTFSKNNTLYLTEWQYVGNNNELWGININDFTTKTMIGVISCSEDIVETNAIAIDIFEILEEYQKYGYGKIAYLLLEDKYKGKYKKITLAADDEKVMAFWSKLGFVQDNDYYDGGLYMTKSI